MYGPNGISDKWRLGQNHDIIVVIIKDMIILSFILGINKRPAWFCVKRGNVGVHSCSWAFFLKQNIPIIVNRSNYAWIIIFIYNYTIYTYHSFCKFMLFITLASHIHTIISKKEFNFHPHWDIPVSASSGVHRPHFPQHCKKRILGEERAKYLRPGSLKHNP